MADIMPRRQLAGLLLSAAPLLAAPLLLATPATAAPTPTPSPGAQTVTRAGTSFLTATAISPGQPVRMSASTGDYLYWSFTAGAGQTDRVDVTVTLPDSADRHGDSTWAVDVFDGLRRRQACTAGAQTPTAGSSDSTVVLGCVLRQVRSWAEPWSGDPLPGSYYLRLAVTDLPEADLGLPIQVELLVTADDDGDPQPEGGDLAVDLKPAAEAGSTASPQATAGLAGESTDDDDDWDFSWDWLPARSTRWFWTVGGGILAACATIVGFALTRPRRPLR